MAKVPNPPEKKPKAKSVRQRRKSNVVTVAVGLGTSGVNIVRKIAEVEPSMRKALIAFDAENPRAASAALDIYVTPLDQPLSTTKTNALHSEAIAKDDWLQSVKLPAEAEKGAGACKSVGTIKAAATLPAFRQKVNRTLARQLLKTDTDERLIVDIHIAAAASGGFGSGLIPTVTLIIRDEVRKIAPRARCNVTVHLVLSSLYEPLIADPRLRGKIVSNDFGTFLELNFTHDPRNVAAHAKHLGCAPPMVPTYDRVIPYHVSDEQGRTAKLRDLIADRVLPNIFAVGNQGLFNRLREFVANLLVLQDHAYSESVLHPIVSVAQAVVVRVPHQFGECWVLDQTLAEIAKLLAKPKVARINSFEGPAKALLGLESDQTEIARVCGEQLNAVLLQAVVIKKVSAEQAHDILTQTCGRYRSAVKPGIERECESLIEHSEAESTPKLISALIDLHVASGASLSEIIHSERNLRRLLNNYATEIDKRSEKVADSVKRKQAIYNDLMQSLLARPWLAGRVKEQAVVALNELMNAEVLHLQLRTLHAIVRVKEREIHSSEREVTAVYGETLRLKASLSARRKEAQEIATAESPTLVSVIRPDEFEPALLRVERLIRSANEGMPAADLKALLEGGALAVWNYFEGLNEKRGEFYESFYESSVVDVIGAVKILQLSFSVHRWIESTLRGLSCCSPISAEAADATEQQTVIAASGDDLAAVRLILDRNEQLAFVDPVSSGDPKMIVLHRRIESLTIESIPTFADAKRAASAFPRQQDRGLSAWQTIASNGYVLGAYQQEGLVPDHWLDTPEAEPDRQITMERAGRNGDGY